MGETSFRWSTVHHAGGQYGLTYRCNVYRWESDKDGNIIDDMDWLGSPAAIYSQDGKLLFYE